MCHVRSTAGSDGGWGCRALEQHEIGVLHTPALVVDTPGLVLDTPGFGAGHICCMGGYTRIDVKHNWLGVGHTCFVGGHIRFGVVLHARGGGTR